MTTSLSTGNLIDFAEISANRSCCSCQTIQHSWWRCYSSIEWTVQYRQPTSPTVTAANTSQSSRLHRTRSHWYLHCATGSLNELSHFVQCLRTFCNNNINAHNYNLIRGADQEKQQAVCNMG